MTKITISYRREDSGVIAGRIFDRLVARYGADTVFRDIDNIPPGLDFRKYINNALDTTDILLAIVGPQWAGRTGDGRVRIQELTDLVRLEVEAALRKDIVVIPVLVGNAIMPQPSELPDTLQDFAFRNAVKVDGLEDFDDHVRRLIRSMDRLIESQRAAQSKPPLEPPAPAATISAEVGTNQTRATRTDNSRSEGQILPSSDPKASPASKLPPANAGKTCPVSESVGISVFVILAIGLVIVLVLISLGRL
jgi:hypothetical protein